MEFRAFFCSILFLMTSLSYGMSETLAESNQGRPSGYVIAVSEAITPPIAEYIKDALNTAMTEKHDFVVIELDTPGGLYQTTRAIGQTILSSPIPVITYVSPNGARAASAGTFILYASHIAAMAPSTHVGAATPVPISPNNDENKNSAMSNKIMSDSTAYIRSLAQYRNRNIKFGIAAITDAASLTAVEALDEKVIDAVAAHIDELLDKVDGIKVKMPDGTITMKTKGARIKDHPISLKQNILFTITDPNITYLLLMAGIYGLLIELFNPGSIVPGTIGAVCLLIASYSLHILPINYAGLALMILGVVFLTAEAFMPSFGILGIAGIISLFIGSFFLYDGIEWAEPSLWVILSVIGSLSVGVIMLVKMNISAHKKQPVSGLEFYKGKTAVVIESHNGEYAIRCSGNIWQAKCEEEIHVGQEVVIDTISGLKAYVKPKENSDE